MKIALQDISTPFAQTAESFKKIFLTNGDQFYPFDTIQNQYHEFALHVLGENSITNNSWRIISTSENKGNIFDKKIVLEHTTRSRNILCITTDALSALHHSSYILNANSEIIPITSPIRANIIKQIYAYAGEGNSVLGIAIKKVESKLSITPNFHNGIFIALVLHDFILLPSASTTTDKFKKTKISVKIFSKELLPACKWFARKIGIVATDDFCITSDILQSMSDAELATHIHHITIFAEMRPVDLVRVSRLYNSNGNAIVN